MATSKQKLFLILLHNLFGRLIHHDRPFIVTFGFNMRNHWALTAFAAISVSMVRIGIWMAMRNRIGATRNRWMSVAPFVALIACSSLCWSCCSGFCSRGCSLLSSLLAHLLAASSKHARNNQGCKCQLRFNFHRLGLFHCLRESTQIVAKNHAFLY